MVDIKSGFLFPWQFRLVAVIAILLAFGILNYQPWVSPILILAGIFVLTLQEGTEVNAGNQTFREYTAFFFIKTGKFHRYPGAEKIYITKSKQSQQMYTAHTTHSSVFEDIVYNGYLKFSSGEKIHLLSIKGKDKVIKKLTPLSQALKLEIVDHA